MWVCPDYSATHLAITGEIRRAPKCEECGNETVLQEHLRIRTVGDYYSVRAFSADAFRTPVRVGRIHQSISVRLADDLCVPVRLGHEYVITGVFNPPNLLFSAWAIEEV